LEKDKTTSHHITPYSTYIIVWVSLMALTSITVAIAGFDVGLTGLFIALSIAAVKSALVINIFMHIKFDELIFKVFLGVSLMTLFVIFLLTSFDILNR
jgi:cytochrome c oxidase subunit 4